jgi:ATP-dependent Lon protease
MNEFVTENHPTPAAAILPLLPLKNVVLLPRSIIPVIVGRASSISAVEYALKHDKSIFVTAQKNPETEVPLMDDIHAYGTRSTILQIMRMPKGALKILVEGVSRAEAVQSEMADNCLLVHTRDIPSIDLEESTELFALWRNLQALYQTYVQLNTKAPADLLASAKTADEMDALADTLSVHLNLSFAERQALLETVSLKERLFKLCGYVQKELDILETEERIRGRVQSQVEKSQREYYLTEQMKAIQKELGRDDQTNDVHQIRAKLKTLQLPAEVAEKIERELKRLEQMPPMSAEASISKHYIDWLISLPWSKISADRISLEEAEKILDQNHAGLKKVKERIIEFLAAKKFSSKLERSPIICLVGPPGVGKTSLAQSISETLGREFVRISLGGIRDEAEIRGHRRTYIGALPGKIIQAMRKAKTVNPVILLDEIDKMSSDIHGDPAAALLEVLDPEQNKSFVDHFLEVEYDLSKVMFITTANQTEGIPYPLFDRMEMIFLSGYTEQEKMDIARNFLLPKSLKEYGLKKTQFVLPDPIIAKVIDQYTKEAGVRQLERTIAKLMRKAIQVLLKDKSVKTITVTDELVKSWLGNPKFKKTILSTGKVRIGLATGLAWTEFGGDILEVEVTVLPGKGGLTMTGQLGEVMQESAQAALSYIRSRAGEFGLKESFYADKEIHVHVPEGATPKDGPSAGITMCVALLSALIKDPTRATVAMTGEITLRGRILGVGGLKEKLLAAKQHGIKTVLLPADNKDDVEEFKAELGEGLECIFVSNMDEVMPHVFEKNPFELISRKKNGNGKQPKKAQSAQRVNKKKKR